MNWFVKNKNLIDRLMNSLIHNKYLCSFTSINLFDSLYLKYLFFWFLGLQIGWLFWVYRLVNYFDNFHLNNL